MKEALIDMMMSVLVAFIIILGGHLLIKKNGWFGVPYKQTFIVWYDGDKEDCIGNECKFKGRIFMFTETKVPITKNLIVGWEAFIKDDLNSNLKIPTRNVMILRWQLISNEEVI